MKTKQELSQVHPVYAQNIEHWEYYWRSYAGGHQYREGAYLRKYLNEEAAPGDQYNQRLVNTALQNHVKSIVHIYRSYLFRNEPSRVLGNLLNQQDVRDWITDVDLNGTDIDQFMKTLNDNLMIYGTSWVVLDRPSYKTQTRAEELTLGIRAYANQYVPSQVIDWAYESDFTGRKRLAYLKIIESRTATETQILIWYPDKVERYWTENTAAQMVMTDSGGLSKSAKGQSTITIGKISKAEQYINPLGYVPAFKVSIDAETNGIGQSQIADIADTQRAIYNRLSELEQNIRISGHPTLVKTVDTQANAGAGAVIHIPEDLDPGLFPRLLQPNGSTASSILDSIQMDVNAIDKMAHVSGIRGSVGSPMSGVALQTEMQMLNSRLSDIAGVLQETEIRMWMIWVDWQGLTLNQDFEIIYEKSFDIRDRHSDIELLRKADELSTNQDLDRWIQKELAKMLIGDEAELRSVIDSIGAQPTPPSIDGDSTDN